MSYLHLAVIELVKTPFPHIVTHMGLLWDVIFNILGIPVIIGTVIGLAYQNRNR